MIHDSWPYRAIRSLGMFLILYVAIAFIVSIMALFIYGGLWPVVSMAITASIFAAALWALLQSGRSAETNR